MARDNQVSPRVSGSLVLISFSAPLERAEEARATVLELAPGGFEETQHDDAITFGLYVEAGRVDAICAVLGTAEVNPVAPGWEDGWRAFHRPVRAGGVWIGPPWEPPPPGEPVVVIDPGRAFGTGAHPTTRLCVELLAAAPRGSLLDVGCGSGVLAIAAARLGYGPLTAIDDDPVAVEVTRANALANGVELEAAVVDATADRSRRRTSPSRTSCSVRWNPCYRICGRGSRSPPATSPANGRGVRVELGGVPRARRLGSRSVRTPPPGRDGVRRTPTGHHLVSGHGVVLDELPRVQGVVRRPAGDPGAAARGRPRRGRRGWRHRGRQHLLRHTRGRLEVASGRVAQRPRPQDRLRDGMRREPARRGVCRPARQRRRDEGAQRGRRRRWWRATSARSDASTQAAGSTACVRSSRSRTAARSPARSA